MALDLLRGASAHRIAVLAGLKLSILQSATLKAIAGRPDERLTSGELVSIQEAAECDGKPRAGGYRTIVLRVGRRGGKTLHISAPFVVSAALARVDHLLAPGEKARVLLVAPTLPHLRQLTDGVVGILQALGVPFSRREREIELGGGLRTMIESVVADHLGPRGGTAIAAVVDEAALLPYEETADGFDEETLAAIRPALSTLKGKLLIVSSPWAAGIGAHAKLVDSNRGSFDREVLALAGPTWRWNPSLTEEQTHAEEPDDRRWRREWLAEPGNESDNFLDAKDVRACVEHGVEARRPGPGTVYRIGVDLAFRRDEAWMIAGHRELRSRVNLPPLDIVVVDAMKRFTPRPGAPLDFNVAMHELVAMSQRFNRAVVHYDSHAAAAVEAALRSAATVGEEVPVGASDQERQWNILRARILNGGLVLLDGSDGNALVKQLIGLRVRLGQRGQIHVSAPEKTGAHDDGADALKLLCWALVDVIPGGNSTIFLDLPVGRDVNGHWRDGTPQYYEERRLSTGEVMTLPTAAPRGSTLWFEEREERRARGQSLVGLDEDEDTLSIPIKH